MTSRLCPLACPSLSYFLALNYCFSYIIPGSRRLSFLPCHNYVLLQFMKLSLFLCNAPLWQCSNLSCSIITRFQRIGVNLILAYRRIAVRTLRNRFRRVGVFGGGKLRNQFRRMGVSAPGRSEIDFGLLAYRRKDAPEYIVSAYQRIGACRLQN